MNGDARCNFCDGPMPCYCPKPGCTCKQVPTGNEHNGVLEMMTEPCENCLAEYERDLEARNRVDLERN